MNEESLFNQLTTESTVNINGYITPAKDAKISIFDRGFLYGDSIYEVTYTDKGTVIFLEEHLDRLYNSAALLDMHIFYSRDEIKKQILDTLHVSRLDTAYVRLVITRGETTITLDPNVSFKNNLIIIVKPRAKHPQLHYDEGIKLFISTILRNDIMAVNPNAKSGNYLNNVMAISEAKKYGADDALMVNKNQEVTEGTTFNIWYCKNGEVITPDLSSGLLKGITREKVINICRDNDIKISIKKVSIEELLAADEVFITSTTRAIMPVKAINQTLFYKTSNSLVDKISSLYNQLINNELKMGPKYL